MRSLKNLDIEKSIQTRKLVSDESWFDKFDTYINYLMFLGLMAPAIFSLGNIKSSANSDFEYFLLICPLLFGLYGFYCKFTERHLKEIKFTIQRRS